VDTSADIQPRYEIAVVRDEGGLKDHLVAWEDLAHNLAEPNAFYEPWALLPALRQFGTGLDLSFVLVYLSSNAHRPEPLLCGFFPLQRRRLYRFLPVAVLEPWRHLYCPLCTPLLRQGHAKPVLETFFSWLSRDSLGAPLLRLKLVSGDGAFTKALTDTCYRRRRPTHLVEGYCRAFIEPRADADSYIRAAHSGPNLKRYRRRERVLASQGRLERRVLAPDEDVAAWAEMFLKLEAKGWKGRQGTAMLCRPADAAYFRDMVQGACAAGKLMMLGLFLDGKPLALKCSLHSGTGSFAFKSAFDEDYAASSPGKLLEFVRIELLHKSNGAEWMDSCTVAEHPVLNHFWMERRLILDQYVATGRAPGDLLVSVIPLGRWVKRLVRPAPRTEEIKNVMWLNSCLRRLGIKARPPGQNEDVDHVKSIVMRAYNRAAGWRT
jgi:hypothetical protein